MRFLQHRHQWLHEAVEDHNNRVVRNIGLTNAVELELALVSALMLLFLPVVWIHYYLLLAAPLAILPAWWSARQLPVRWGVSVLLVAGLWLASGSDVRGNHYYGRHHESWQFRIQQNAQPLGAVLLVLGLCAPLAEIARRQRLRANVSRESR